MACLDYQCKRKDITKADLLVVGKSIQCKKAAEIIDQINDVVQDWQTFANEVSVKPALRDAIAKTLININ